ncbi:ADP-ribose pyrophosphatase [Lactiplantibacillus plantarum]|uniref:ADP-ribose pyrophosphatase n=1 Tax=Lactiplantibacillus plantarum TaxID=1590 RepID=A0AAW3RJC4_LACPN|nr:ADP-ribose pyrophosphatase [Lactiplantibacillus plantarum]
MPLHALTEANASPLVLKAKAVLLSGQFDPSDQTYPDWTVLDHPVY